MEGESATRRVSIRELVRYFLRLGLLGFGGPVALVGQMERELVDQRAWLSTEQMREAIAVCQSLPGPLAIQVGIYVSYLRGGFWGAWAGGWAFIFPNFAIVAALGALYVHYGGLQPVIGISNRNVQGFIKGAYAAAIGTILGACVLLGRIAIGDWLTVLIGAAALVALFRWQMSNALLIAVTGAIGLIAFPLLHPMWVLVR